MTLAVIFVVAAVLALGLILGVTISRSLQISTDAGLSGRIQPVDIQAFRNLINPAEDEYLRRHLPGVEFRIVRRERLRAIAAYVRVVARNAAVLVHIGQSALASNDARTVEAAKQLVDEALLLRRNATVALFRIYLVLAWPNAGLFVVPILHEYEQMSGAAMLLGRLQNPSSPVRTSATW